MRRTGLIGLIGHVFALLILLPSAALASEVTSVELVEHPEVWDGEEVTFTGEAIGDCMIRGGEAWLHVNDDRYATQPIPAGAAPVGYNSGHAVVASPQMAAVVQVFGDHRHNGDLIEVTGVFNAACPVHGGDMDVHATAIRVVGRGSEIAEHLDRRRLVVLVVLSLVAATLAARGAALRRGP